MYSWSAQHVSLLLWYQRGPWSMSLHKWWCEIFEIKREDRGERGTAAFQSQTDSGQSQERGASALTLRLRGWTLMEEGVLAPQLSLPVGGDELNGEGEREKERERGREETADVVCLAWIWKGRKGEKRSWRHPQRGRLVFVLWGGLRCKCHRRTLGR